MMDITKVTVKVRDHVQFTVIDNEAVIIDVNSGKYLGLDEVGTRIWQVISETGSFAKVIEALLKEYQVSEDVLQRDVTKLIEEFSVRGFLEIEE
jgi:hypothetical protein